MVSITYVWCEKVIGGEGAIILNFLIVMTLVSLKWLLFLIWFSSTGCACFSLYLGFSGLFWWIPHFDIDIDFLLLFKHYSSYSLSTCYGKRDAGDTKVRAPPSLDFSIWLRSYNAYKYSWWQKSHDGHAKGIQPFPIGLSTSRRVRQGRERNVLTPTTQQHANKQVILSPHFMQKKLSHFTVAYTEAHTLLGGRSRVWTQAEFSTIQS